MLRVYEPCLPSKAPKPPVGDGWVHEIKHDGYRLIARRVGDRVSLRTRGGFDWSKRYPRIASSILNLPVASIVLLDCGLPEILTALRSGRSKSHVRPKSVRSRSRTDASRRL
jgi:ATP-dependent DNA ligase